METDHEVRSNEGDEMKTDVRVIKQIELKIIHYLTNYHLYIQYISVSIYNYLYESAWNTRSFVILN